MAMRWPQQKQNSPSTFRQKKRRTDFIAAAIEPLDRRLMLAVTAVFALGELKITGDDQDNAIVVSRDAGGNILVNNGAVPIQNGPATINNTNHFHILGLGGNDTITFDETSGPLPGAAIFGGDGNDTLTAGSGDDFIEGEGGNDTAFLGAGDDTFSWGAGDGSDIVDGQAGTDSLVFNGTNAAEQFDITDSGAGTPAHRVLLTRDLNAISMNLGTIEEIDLNTLDGADVVNIDDQSATDLALIRLDLEGSSGLGDSETDLVNLSGSESADTGHVSADNGVITANVGHSPTLNIIGAGKPRDRLTLNALGGNDTIDASALPAGLIDLAINGGVGDDLLFGSAGDDQVTGGAGNDTVFLGAGDDTFTYAALDGNDVINGDDGVDTLNYTGSNAAEDINVTASNSRTHVIDASDNLLLNFDGIEQASFTPLGGADGLAIGDLTGTSLTNIKVKLNSDSQADQVTVTGTDVADAIIVDGDFFNGVTIDGLPVQVKVFGGFDAADGLTIDVGGGADRINAAALDAGAVLLTLDGGTGNDSLTGSHGNDTFLWNPGDASDDIEGQGGTDSLLFVGSDAAEQFALSASAGRVQLTRDVGSVAMSLNDVETVNLNTLAGADTVTVNDLSTTDLKTLNLNLDSALGANVGDNAADNVIVNGTNNADNVQIASFGLRVALQGLSAAINITGEDGLDSLTLNTLGGNDTVNAANLAATNASELIRLTLAGGAGNDTLTGSQGADFFLWNAGDGSDIIDGGDDPDTLIFSGSDADEQFDLSANGPRVRLTRNLGGVLMDLGGIETITLNTLSGADTTAIGDLSTTPVTRINVSQAAAPGTTHGDAQPNSVTVEGRSAADFIPVLGNLGAVVINGGFADNSGLPYFIVISSVEPTDTVRVNGNGGNDTIDVELDTPVNLNIDGGDGQDTLNISRTAANTAVRILPSSGDDAVNVATHAVGSANVTFDDTQRIGALSIAGGGLASITAGGNKVLTVTSLAIAGSGQLDLRDNALVIDYAAASPIGTVQSLLKSGFAGGAWNGAGIISDLADASNFGLGYAEAADVAGTLAGQLPDGTSLVVKLALYGDGNLDGTVNFTDLVQVAQHFSQAAANWAKGDFNYDGTVDFADLVHVAQNFNRTTPFSTRPILAAALPQRRRTVRRADF